MKQSILATLNVPGLEELLNAEPGKAAVISGVNRTLAAAIACLTGPLDQVERQRMQYQERRDAICDGLEALGWERPNAHGSMFVWARIPNGRMDSQAFALELMERAGVIVTPGASFGPSGEGYVRIALVLPPEGLREAVAASGAAFPNAAE